MLGQCLTTATPLDYTGSKTSGNASPVATVVAASATKAAPTAVFPLCRPFHDTAEGHACRKVPDRRQYRSFPVSRAVARSSPCSFPFSSFQRRCQRAPQIRSRSASATRFRLPCISNHTHSTPLTATPFANSNHPVPALLLAAASTSDRLGGPLGSRPPPLVPTASHATNAYSAQAIPSQTTVQQKQQKRQKQQTSRPSALPHHPSVPLDYPQPPFRNRAADTLQRPLRRLSTARLWNPTNSTPRGVASPSTTLRQQQQQQQQQNATQLQPQRLPSGAAATSSSARRRAPSTPPPPAVPLSHPALHDETPVAQDDPVGTGAADYPLLTLPEQRQIRHSSSPRASLQVERAGSEKRVSLPRSVRHSYDGKRLSLQPPDAESTSIAALSASQADREDEILPTSRQEDEEPISRPATTAAAEPAFGLTLGHPTRSTKEAKGKGRATSTNITTMAPSIDDERLGGAGRSFSKDLERGPDILGHHHGLEEGHNNRDSTASLPDGMGIGSAISSSNSSIMGDPDAQQDIGEEWGPQHPCFPHRNPHVSVDDPEYISTRIIRIRRDWLIMGDLAPTFSNLYPEILDPAGMNEPEFRRVIDKLNTELTAVFAPWSARNIVDGVLGLVTGWLWEDLGLTGAKARLARLERWIEAWNREMARTADEGAPIPPKIIPLRQTGYMTLDIQIGDPEIAPEPPSTPALSRSEMPLEATAAS